MAEAPADHSRSRPCGPERSPLQLEPIRALRLGGGHGADAAVLSRSRVEGGQVTTVRAATHVHSEWSYHARWPLRSIADQFARRGYDAVFMSDHERGFNELRWRAYRRACDEASDERIRLVPGIEYEDRQNVVHVGIWGSSVPFLGEARATLDLLRAASSEGAAAVFGHPGRRDAITSYRPEWAEHLTGVEVWNRQYDGMAPNARAIRFALE